MVVMRKISANRVVKRNSLKDTWEKCSKLVNSKLTAFGDATS